MELIEQAVFTSAQTDRSAGYQVVAASPGICRDDLAELAVWGPSHDALMDCRPGASSVNFHPLPSGSFCVSRTTAAGWEYSGRGARIYTQCLVVPAVVLKRFANNPFAVMRAALANGVVCEHRELPSRLERFRLSGRTAAVDVALLARLAANPGPDRMAALVEAALGSVSVAVVCGSERVIAGLVNCLPPECRTEFSFSTGLKFSSRRPFRVVAIPDDLEEQRRVERSYNVTVLELGQVWEGDSPVFPAGKLGQSPDPFVAHAAKDPWARFIWRVLKSGRTSLLASQLANRQLHVTPEELPSLAVQLLEELDGHESCEAAEEQLGDCPDFPAGKMGLSPSQTPSSERTRADAAHGRFSTDTGGAEAAKCRPDGPSMAVDPASPQMLPVLEALDDLIYEAVAGREAALDEIRSAWQRLCHDLDDRATAQCREHYLHYAMSLWTSIGQSEDVDVDVGGRAIRSLDILTVLLDEPHTPPPA